MKTKIMSKPQINKLLSDGCFPDNTAVISFYGKYQEPVIFPSDICHLSLCIDDYRTIWEVTKPQTFHIDDFKEAAKFILDCQNNGYNLICQCEAGYSRSAGCAMAVEEFFNHNGISIYKDYFYSPNQIFFNNIYDCLVEEYSKRTNMEA